MCTFVHAKRLKWLEIFLSWLTLEMLNLDDYRKNLQIFHELEKLNFFVESFLWTFYHSGFKGSVV